MTEIYLIAIIAGLVVMIVSLLMSILKCLNELNRLVREQLHQMGLSLNDDSSRVLKMDFGNHKAARFTDRSKQWIQDRETASRG